MRKNVYGKDDGTEPGLVDSRWMPEIEGPGSVLFICLTAAGSILQIEPKRFGSGYKPEPAEGAFSAFPAFLSGKKGS